jgi:hypothetical protein
LAGADVVSFDLAQLRNVSVMLDTEAENITDRLQMVYGDERKSKDLVESRARLWRTAKLLREIAKLSA